MQADVRAVPSGSAIRPWSDVTAMRPRASDLAAEPQISLDGDFYRQTEMKTRAAAVGVIGRDRAFMRFRDRANDGQPHAQALRFGGEELLEHPFACFFRKTDAV